MKRKYTSLSAVGLLMLAFLFIAPAQAQEKQPEQLTWLTNLGEAHRISTETGKPVMAFFTGSDWCGWCRKLQADVFRKPDFIKWANENVILLELDFPRRTQLAPELAQQNRQLQQIFQVRGYPTIWYFTTTLNQENQQLNLNKLGSTGYPRGATVGKEEVKFIAASNQILAKNTAQN